MFGGGLIAVAADEDQITIWDIRDRAHPQKRMTMSTHPTPVRFIAFSPVENLLAAACDKGIVRLFDAKSGAEVASIPFPESEPTVTEFNADGTVLAVGLENGTVQVWDTVRRRQLGEVRGWNSSSIGLAFSRHGELVAAMTNRTIGVWSPTVRLIRTLGTGWRPRDADDAKRLSGLSLDGFDLRLLTVDEEQSLKIDASSPLENIALADYWSAYWTTVRNFAALKNALENKSYIPSAKVDEADILAQWLNKYANAKSFRTVSQTRDTLRINLARSYDSPGSDALLQGEYARALSVFEEAQKIIPERAASHYRPGRGFALGFSSICSLTSQAKA